ncbi:30S ribosomal protein S9 [Candidatus Pacearchaeota archaeon]|nr:30S ribosomal protein S9 [Candidatus Pacearchaeota archaeon]
MTDKIVSSGKRKRSVAKAVALPGSGKVTINKVPYQLLPLVRRLMIEEPLRIAKEKFGSLNYDINVRVRGGGQESGIEAARLAIARVLVEATKSKELKKAYSDYDRNLIVADIRVKEAYKPGDSKARAKRQKSYR